MNSPNRDNFPNPEMKALFQAVLTLKTEAEAEAFFRDLLTLPELTEFANRWQIVKLLVQNKSYSEIATKLKVSTTTVTRVAHWLYHGMGGYRLVSQRVFKSK